MRLTTLMPLTGTFYRGDCTPARAVRSGLDTWFDDFFRGFDRVPLANELATGQGFLPKVNIVEKDKTITITAELPGIDEKDLDVSITDEAVTIKGEKRHELKEGEGTEAVRTELSYGTFERVIPLQMEVDTDKVEAVYSKGVLTVTLPKAEPAEDTVRSIPVKVK